MCIHEYVAKHSGFCHGYRPKWVRARYFTITRQQFPVRVQVLNIKLFFLQDFLLVSFRFDSKQAGDVKTRAYPCFCVHCMREDFENCENLAYCGSFVQHHMKAKELRKPKARYVTADRPISSQYKPRQLLASRMFECNFQYLVAWEGYSDTTWVNADSLSCHTLMEQYEQNSNA